MELLRNILSTNLTHVQIFICCAVVMFLCFGFIIFTFFKLFLGVVSQVNAEVEKKEALEEKVNLNQKDKKKDIKKKLILLFSIIGILGVVDWYSDKIPFMFDTASNTEMSFSVFFLLVAIYTGKNLFEPIKWHFKNMHQYEKFYDEIAAIEQYCKQFEDL